MIYFKDLSTPLKIAIVSSWVVMGLYALTFLIGFISGTMTEVL